MDAHTCNDEISLSVFHVRTCFTTCGCSHEEKKTKELSRSFIPVMLLRLYRQGQISAGRSLCEINLSECDNLCKKEKGFGRREKKRVLAQLVLQTRDEAALMIAIFDLLTHLPHSELQVPLLSPLVDINKDVSASSHCSTAQPKHPPHQHMRWCHLAPGKSNR